MRIYKTGVSQAIQGTIAVNLCICFPEHALFLKQSGEFESQWPKNAYILS